MSVALDHTPAPGAAPARARVLGHARTEVGLLLRNGEQLLLALVIPVGLLVGGRAMAARLGLDPRAFPASVLALALFSTTFTSLAIATAFERRYGVLERLAATPLGRTGLLLGKAVAITTVAALQLLVLGAVALLLGWRPAADVGPWLVTVATSVLAAVAFAALGLVLAGALRAEVVLGLANLLYLVLAGCGLVVPVWTVPGWTPLVLRLLPTAALGEAWRNAATGHLALYPVLVCGVWALVLGLVARKVFRWMQ